MRKGDFEHILQQYKCASSQIVAVLLAECIVHGVDRNEVIANLRQKREEAVLRGRDHCGVLFDQAIDLISSAHPPLGE